MSAVLGYWRADVQSRKGVRYESWRVYLGRDEEGKRVLKRCRTEEEARKLASHYKQCRTEVDLRFLRLPDEKKQVLIELVELAKSRGVELRKLKSFCEHQLKEEGKKKECLLSECMEKYLKGLAGRRSVYLNSLRWYLEKFLSRVGEMPVTRMSYQLVETVYQEISLRSRASWKNRLSGFFSWCVKHEYLPENYVRKLQLPRLDREAPRILSLEECRRLLRGCREEDLGQIVLELFGGVRPAEAQKLSQSYINEKLTEIKIGGEMAKTRSFRLVPIAPNMAEWMKLCFNREKVTVESKGKNKIRKSRRYLARLLGLKNWPRDCLRHTAASMRLQRDKNAEKVALDLGNSPAVLHRYYKNLVSEEDCRAFWSLNPDTVRRN